MNKGTLSAATSRVVGDPGARAVTVGLRYKFGL
jgi:hypothetical protein